MTVPTVVTTHSTRAAWVIAGSVRFQTAQVRQAAVGWGDQRPGRLGSLKPCAHLTPALPRTGGGGRPERLPRWFARAS